MKTFIPFGKPFIAGKELLYIEQAALHGHLSGDGLYTERCHKWFEGRLGCKRALLTHSCTAALEMAAILCDLSPGDEVILPSFTFVSTANAFVLRGAVPVFVDIRRDTLNIDETLIEAAITPKTRAIVPVHYAGVACDMNAIMAIANRHDLVVIEDAAQALLSIDHGRALGTIGHLGCLSFHETKNIICGEGGALLINDPRYIERAEIIREKGTNRSQFFRGAVDKYTWVDIGSSYLPGELIGAFLYGQLEHADEITDVRRRIFRRYYELLRPLQDQNLVRLPIEDIDSSPNKHIFFLITQSLEQRTVLLQYLKTRNILAVIHFVPLHSSPAGVKYGRVSESMSVTDFISDRLVRLPIYHEMRDEDIERVADAVTSFFCGSS